jgi:hypothetical protein
MSHARSRAALGAGAALACALLFGGCAGKYDMAPVRGRVTTCQGKPAAGGVVVFQPLDAPDKTGRPAGHPGMASEGTVGADGTFTLTCLDGKSGAIVGPHRILFRMPLTRRPTLTAEERATLSPEDIKAAEADLNSKPVYAPIPCGDKVTPNEVEVKPGQNEFDFTLPPK